MCSLLVGRHRACMEELTDHPDLDELSEKIGRITPLQWIRAGRFLRDEPLLKTHDAVWLARLACPEE